MAGGKQQPRATRFSACKILPSSPRHRPHTSPPPHWKPCWQVKIHKAYGDLYSAIIDKKVAMKIGPGDWSPTSDKVDVGQKEWKLLHSGPNFAVWEAVL